MLGKWLPINGLRVGKTHEKGPGIVVRQNLMKLKLTGAGRGVNSVDAAASLIRKGIREGRFAPGQRLIARDLADLSDGTVGPFREALFRLAGEGLVTLHPNRGAAVRTLSRDDAGEIYLLRESVDGLAARLCAARAGADKKLAAEVGAGAEKLARAFRAGRISEFHAAKQGLLEIIRDGCGAARVKEIAQSLWAPICRKETDAQIAKAALAAAYAELKDVCERIISGEEDEAERAMRRHVKHSGEGVLAAIGAA